LCVQVKIITQQPECSEKGDEHAMGEGDCDQNLEERRKEKNVLIFYFLNNFQQPIQQVTG
jgi:hypothetical protein